jgi:hypothetical protein
MNSREGIIDVSSGVGKQKNRANYHTINKFGVRMTFVAACSEKDKKEACPEAAVMRR